MIITATAIAAIIKAIAFIEVVVLVSTAVLNFTQIVDWFNARRTNIPALDKDQIYFTLRELWSTGNYKTVQGVFNTRTHRLADLRRIKSTSVDYQLADAHRSHRLVNYE
jgi:hypothetical protein